MANTEDPVAANKVVVKEEAEEQNRPGATGEEEDTGAEVAPIVRLQEVAVSTGEENEDVLLDLRAKLYRFDNEGNQWKERGVGTVKLLKHKETGKVRLVMRQSRTLKICANHLVLPTISMKEHAGNEKSCVWHAADFADGELKQETFCIRFPSVEDCRTFKEKVEEIAEAQGNTVQESEEGQTAASLIETLSVSSKDQQEPKNQEAAESKSEKDGTEKPENPSAEK